MSFEHAERASKPPGVRVVPLAELLVSRESEAPGARGRDVVGSGWWGGARAELWGE